MQKSLEPKREQNYAYQFHHLHLFKFFLDLNFTLCLTAFGTMEFSPVGMYCVGMHACHAWSLVVISVRTSHSIADHECRLLKVFLLNEMVVIKTIVRHPPESRNLCGAPI